MLIKNLFRYLTYQVFSPGTVLRKKYESFKALLAHDKAAHEFMAILEDIYYGQKKYDFQVVVKTYEQFAHSVLQMVNAFLKMCPSRYWSLIDYFKKFDFYVRFMLAPPEHSFSPPFTIEFNKASLLNESIAGKKAFSLSQLNQKLHLPTPDGFVITTRAFHYFLEANDLRGPINEKLAALDISDPQSLEKTAFELESLILAAHVPEDIEIEVRKAIVSGLLNKGVSTRVALRSSAVKEDGNASFAGQYQTLLNVDSKDILNGYKQVIAGKYSAQALFYRVSYGILDEETPMAVLVLEMVNARNSGVIYTQNAANPLSDDIMIHSVHGEGRLLVEGEKSPDVITVSRKNPNTIAGIKISANRRHIMLEKSLQTDQRRQTLLFLDEPSILTLARWGILLEDHFNQPQDIEWCQDQSGRLFLLQARPLNLHISKTLNTAEHARTIGNKILCSKGELVCPGVGAGTVYRLDQLSQLNQIPAGSVLVVRHALPQFVIAIDKMAAIVIETGSRASHFSSIAREFGVPAITNVENCFSSLVHGNRVTVDAAGGIVYEGDAEPLMGKAIPTENFFKDSSFMVRLRYVINFCAKLKLTDPNDTSFIPEACRSLHDIIRFTHETAVQEMFLTGNRKGGRKKGAKKLISHMPMLFYVIDVGQGFKTGRNNEKILKPEDIASEPMNAILKGLSHPEISWDETAHFDWEEYDKVVMAGGIISADSPRFGSYAIVSKDYANINFRFGYHFAIIDTICSDSKEDNYILFRFSGGGGSPSGRLLRACFLEKILTRLGFMVEIKSDLVDAEFKNGSLSVMKETLDIIGRLLGATKLMDMYLKENSQLETIIDDFMNGRYDFRSVVDEKR